MKGAGSFSYDFRDGDTPVGRSLQQCQMIWRDISLPDQDQTQTHKNKGNCAEPMAAHLYYKNNGNNLQDQKARIGTWVKARSEWKQIDPCGTGEEVSNRCHVYVFRKDHLINVQDLWGCNLFTSHQGLRVISTTTPTEPYTLANLAGGPTLQEQIQLCGGQPRVFVG